MRGRIIAFGGRILGEGEPKYLNSPETPLFHKGRVLYGLAQARRPAAERGELIVTEGYMDVIALSRAGFDAAVAPLGTALTEEQMQDRSEEHTSELQSLMRISYAVFCLKKKKETQKKKR